MSYINELEETIEMIRQKLRTNMTVHQKRNWQYILQRHLEKLDDVKKKDFYNNLFDKTKFCTEHPSHYVLKGKTVCEYHPAEETDVCICYKPEQFHGFLCRSCSGILDPSAIERMS